MVWDLSPPNGYVDVCTITGKSIRPHGKCGWRLISNKCSVTMLSCVSLQRVLSSAIDRRVCDESQHPPCRCLSSCPGPGSSHRNFSATSLRARTSILLHIITTSPAFPPPYPSEMESPDGADPGIINKAILLLEKRIELLLDEWRARATSTWSMNSRNPFSRDLSTLYGCGWPGGGAPEQLTISDGLHGYYIIKLEESGPLPASKQHLQYEFALRRQKLQQSFQELPYNLAVHTMSQILDLEITEFCAAEWEHLVEPELIDWRYDEEADSKALAEPVELQPDPLDAIAQQKIKTMSFPQKVGCIPTPQEQSQSTRLTDTRLAQACRKIPPCAVPSLSLSRRIQDHHLQLRPEGHSQPEA